MIAGNSGKKARDFCMRSLIFISLFFLALAGTILPQGKPVPEYQVPTIREPHHFVKLDNRYARVLDVTVPGYDSTLYHIHENPYFWVAIGNANLKGNILGTTEMLDIIKKDGEVTWSDEITHRVGNTLASTFHNITVQI